MIVIGVVLTAWPFASESRAATADPDIASQLEQLRAQQAQILEILLRLLPAVQSEIQLARADSTADLRERVLQLQTTLATARGPVGGTASAPMGATGPSAKPVQIAALPAAAEPAKKPSRWSLSAEAIYWQPHSDDNILGFYNITESSSGTTTFNSQAVDIEHSRSAGFRASLGYNFNDSPWDLTASYAYLAAYGRQENSNLSTAAGTTTRFTSGEGRQHFHYSVADLTGGYTEALGGDTFLRPFGSIRYAHLSNNFEKQFIGSASGGANEATQTRWKLDGIGPHVGIDGEFGVGGGVVLTGRVGGSMLYGMQTGPTGGASPAGGCRGGCAFPVVSDTSKQGIVPQIDLELGAKWRWRLGGTSEIEIAGGYHFENWFSVVPNGGANDADWADLSLEGPYFRLTGRW